jgi:hypothetical protein
MTFHLAQRGTGVIECHGSVRAGAPSPAPEAVAGLVAVADDHAGQVGQHERGERRRVAAGQAA